MPGFIRRFTEFPSVEVLREIEGVVIVDRTPLAPTTGVGSGTVLLFGEFEDGPFATAALVAGGGGLEVFSGADLQSKFGGLGYDYPTALHANASARRRNGELWNGNGFLKLANLRFNRLLIARVDTSVGEVAFSPLACIKAQKAGPHALTPADTIDITTDQGGPATSDAIAAVAATVAGAAYPATPNSGFVGGETIRVTVDKRQPVDIIFSAAHQTSAQVVARINAVVGYTLAAVNGATQDLTGIQLGTGGQITLADVTPGALAAIGLTAATTNGTGNVADVDNVTDTELATILNGTVALTAIGVVASVVDGLLRVCSNTTAGGTIAVAAGPITTAVDFDPVATTVAASAHGGGSIPAGSRVRNVGGDEWVTMQTLDVPEDEVGPFTVKIRPALDDGSGVAAGPGTITTAFDQSFTDMAVNNPAAVTAALTEAQTDVRYKAAMDATLQAEAPSAQANHSLSARRTDPVVRDGLQNALDASAQGLFGRKFHSGSPLGSTPAQAFLEVAAFRNDRLFYTTLGMRTRIPQIAEVGAAGGLGFTADGVITVRADGPLASVNSLLNPEENPGRETDYLLQFFEVDAFGEAITQDTYKAFRREGICAPRVDRDSGMIFQSGVTSDLTAGRTNQARRKMADFIQDSLAVAVKPDTKKLNTQARRDGLRSIHESFLGGLLSAGNPELQRIEGFSISEEPNTPELRAQGIHIIQTKVRTLASLDSIVLDTEIGEGVITVTEAA